MNIFKDFLFVGAGGAIGSVLRYCAYLLFAGSAARNFPLATLAVNAAGSFLIGFLSVFLQGSNERWRLFLSVGILGGFTTFSSFSHETMVLFNNNQFLHAVINVALNVFLCLLCVFIGFKVGKVFIS
jgi:CrcB protein